MIRLLSSIMNSGRMLLTMVLFCFNSVFLTSQNTLKPNSNLIDSFVKINKNLLKGKKMEVSSLLGSSYILLSSPYSDNLSKDYEVYPLNNQSNRIELGDISINRGNMFKHSLPMAVISKVVLQSQSKYIIESYEEKKNLKYATRLIKTTGNGTRSFSIEFDFNGYLLAIYNTGIEVGTIIFKEVSTGNITAVPLVLGLGSNKPSWSEQITSAKLSEYIGDDINYWYTIINNVKTALSSAFYSKIFKSIEVNASNDKEAKLVLSAKLTNYIGSNASMFVPSAYALSLGVSDSLLSGVYTTNGKGEEKSNYPLVLPIGDQPKEVLGILQQSTVSQVDKSFYVITTK